jgi:hypothetical protein
MQSVRRATGLLALALGVGLAGPSASAPAEALPERPPRLAGPGPPSSSVTASSALRGPFPFGPRFLNRQRLSVDLFPMALAAGDFDGDGRADLVVASWYSDTLNFYPGLGDGEFEDIRTIPLAGGMPVAMVACDLRGTGALDLVVAQAWTWTVGVLLGNGDGTFQPEVSYPLPAPPTSLLVVDVDGAGTMDVVVGLDGTPATGPVATLLGDGLGALGPPLTHTVANEYLRARRLRGEDFNGDGRVDLVVVDDSWGVTLYAGDGTGLFTPGQVIWGHLGPIGAWAVNAVAGRFGGDSCLDVAVSDTLGLLRIFKGNCDGTFDVEASFHAFGEMGHELAIGDLNGDGVPDLVAAGWLYHNHPYLGTMAGDLVSVLLGRADGGFGEAKVYRMRPDVSGLALADFNGDGYLDVAAVSRAAAAASVLLNDGQGGLPSPQGRHIGYTQGAPNSPATGFRAADLDGDGALDLVLVKERMYAGQSMRLTALRNLGDGRFEAPRNFPIFDDTYLGDFVLADFRGTGHPDFLAIGAFWSGGTEFIAYAPGDGEGGFGPLRLTRPVGASGLIAVGDFNNDQNLDFVAASRLDSGPNVNRLCVFAGDGAGGFARIRTILYGGSQGRWPEAIFTGDFNRDGQLDVAVWLYYNQIPFTMNDLYQFLGRGDGSFDAPRVVLHNIGPPAMADVNHNGFPDLIEQRHPVADGQYTRPVFRIFLGQPDGTFAEHRRLEPFAGCGRIPAVFGVTALSRSNLPLVGDFNGNGHVDIAVFQTPTGEPADGFFQFILGNGDGDFTPLHDVFPLWKFSGPQWAADLDGDGRADLVELTQFTSSFNVIPADGSVETALHLTGAPVRGSAVRACLAVRRSAAFDRPVQLRSTDPALGLPADLVLPAHRTRLEFDYTVGDRETFGIEATVGGASDLVWGNAMEAGDPGAGAPAPCFDPADSGPLDVDGNGIHDALTDGLLILRHLFDFRGPSLIDRAVGENAARTTAEELEAFLELHRDEYDVDGDGRRDALTDGLLILRHLFGFRGAALIDRAVSPQCVRCSAESIEEYLSGLLPAGPVTSAP